MIKIKARNFARRKRHLRIRKKVSGTSDAPRFCVFISNKNMYVQLIDDTVGRTLVSASTLEKDIAQKLKSTSNMDAAKLLGAEIAKRALEKNINKVVFDRAGYAYHGKVKALAEAARAAGLKF